MTKLIPVALICVTLALFSDLFSRRDPKNIRYEFKSNIFWLFIIVACTIFAGLRIAYNDTKTYTESYIYLVNSNLDFSDVDWAFGSNPGFVVCNIVMKYFDLSTNALLMVFAFITYGVYIWFIHKYSTDFFMSIILFFCLVFTFPLAGIKQSVAVAFCLIAVDKAINKKWFWFIFWIFIAEMFHAYSFMYLIVPLLFFVPWQDKRTFYWILIFLAAGLLLKPLLGTLLGVTDMLGDEYTVEEFLGAGVNPFRLLVCLVPLVLSFILRKKINSPEYEVTRAEGLCMNLSFLNGEIMFVALFGTANYFARLANYFYIFPIIALPRLFNMISPKWRAVVKIAAVMCYIFFLWYDCTHSGFGTFDQEYFSIKFSDFRFFSR